MPTWLMTIVFAFAFLGLGVSLYWGIGHLRGQTSAADAQPGQRVEHGELILITQDAKKKPIVKFVVTNHSGAEITDLGGNVTVWGRTQKSEEEAAGTFSFASAHLSPYESKEMSAPLTTKLKLYELPDWQNVSTDIQITSPAAF